LGHGYDPLQIGDAADGRSLVNGMTKSPDLSSSRLAARRALLEQLDRRGPYVPARSSAHQDLLRKVYDLIDTPHVRDAFDLGKESARTRDRYGRSRGGQACLLARRLVEAGVPWVTVFFNHNIRGQDDHPELADAYGWDTHNDIFAAMREHLLPGFDHSLSALLEDLEARSLTKDTLVVCMGEFGRAPLVAVERNFKGDSPGRKHWAQCYSILLAGAGIRRGAVYGASDRRGAYPQSSPVAPSDLAATLFHALGIPADTHFTDLTNRPYRVTSGNPVMALFG
jgi:hypothetical protein